MTDRTAPHRTLRQPVIVSYDATRQVPNRGVVQLNAVVDATRRRLLLLGVG